MIRSTMAVLFGIFFPMYSHPKLRTLPSSAATEQMTFGTSLSFRLKSRTRIFQSTGKVKRIRHVYNQRDFIRKKAPILIVLPCTCTVRLYPVIYNTNGAIVQIKKISQKGSVLYNILQL